ncbi:MAG: DUF4358 domain-containing protein [Oscillospiraceae bacterium]|nr:DUF4358 domain-containing protein [Oscillospiraceae bacterium]
MKKIGILCALTAVLTLFSACGSALPSPDATELATEIIETLGETESFALADSETVDIVFGCNSSVYEDYCVMYSTEDISADIIAIFKSPDDDTQDATEEMLEEFLESRLNDFKGYAPLEVQKIENTKLITYGSYDILIIISDFDSAKSVVDSAFATV